MEVKFICYSLYFQPNIANPITQTNKFIFWNDIILSTLIFYYTSYTVPMRMQ